MARRRDSDQPSYDSLLDTVTNLIGILVILLAVTQLGVRDVVRRVVWKLPDISVRELEQTEMQFGALSSSIARLERKVADRLASAVATDDDLRSAEQELEQTTNLVRSLEARESDYRASRDRQQRLQASIDQIRRQNADRQARLADLERALEVTGAVEVLPAEVLFLPNPRPAAPGARAFLILCRHGRVAPADRDNLEQFARLTVETQREQLMHASSDRLGRFVYDPGKIVRYFEHNEIATRDFLLSAAVDEKSGGERLLLTMIPTGGESVRELVAPNSRYRSALSHVDPRTRYVRFVVWPDSFEAYVVARRILQRYHLPAGWTPQLNDQFTVASELGIELHGEREGKAPRRRPGPRPNVLD